jgi:hypothetical protein
MDVDHLVRVFDALCIAPERPDRANDGERLLACVTGCADAHIARALSVSVYREPSTNDVSAAMLVLVDAHHVLHRVAISRQSSTCPWGGDLGLVYDGGHVSGARDPLVLRASSCQAVWFVNGVLLPRLHKLYCAG